VSLPIDLGPESDQVFLILFGTGIRAFSALSAITARIGGANSGVDFAGPQGTFVVLDQVNIRLSRSLIGRGEIDVALTVDGQASNNVRMHSLSAIDRWASSEIMKKNANSLASSHYPM